MRVKREYLTSELPPPQVLEKVVEKIVTRDRPVIDPIIVKRLAQLEALANRILEQTAPEPEDDEEEGPDPEILEIMDRLAALEASLTRMAAKLDTPPPPPPAKPVYEFDVVRNEAGDIQKVVARPVSGRTSIYGGAK